MFLKQPIAAIRRIARGVVLPACLVPFTPPSHAQTHMQEALPGRQAETSAQAGVDYWSRDHQELSPWATVRVGYDLLTHLSVQLKAQTRQDFGGRVDELSATYDVSPSFGLRAGVLDFNLAWCRDYERSNPWVQDPNAFCSDPATRRASGSSPGVQAYATGTRGDYQLQGVAGLYQPELLDYDKAVGTSQKFGMAANALNVITGMEYHLGWLYSDGGQPYRNTLYAALQYPMYLKWTAGASYLLASTVSNQREDWGAELQYHASGTDKWITGLHRSDALRRQAYSMAWRHDWNSGAFSSVQWMRTTTEGTNAADSDALALRMGLQF